MQKSDEVDILVIGGGPAGSTAASMAAKSGLSVKVCEKSKFPREHVGESLLPASIAILEELGLKVDFGYFDSWHTLNHLMKELRCMEKVAENNFFMFNNSSIKSIGSL